MPRKHLSPTAKRRQQPIDAVLRVCTPGEVAEAKRLFQQFNHREAEHFSKLDMNWHTGSANWQKATRIGYRSDKFDGVWRDYTHEHKQPFPDIIVQMNEYLENRGVKHYHLPQPRSVSFLGYALEVEYLVNGKKHHVDWKNHQYLPFLTGDPRTHSLIIVPQCGGYPIILKSKIMRILPEGIVD